MPGLALVLNGLLTGGLRVSRARSRAAAAVAFSLLTLLGFSERDAHAQDQATQNEPEKQAPPQSSPTPTAPPKTDAPPKTRTQADSPEQPTDPPLSTQTPSPKRDVPDMDGRGSPPATAGDVLQWIPRLLLSPFYLINEYLFRWPLSVVVPAAERAELPRKLYDFFTFFPDHRAGIVPIALVEFGFKPSVGVMAFWDNAGFKGNDYKLLIGVWPPDWIGGSLSETIKLDKTHSLGFHVSGIHRPDRVFFGEGPRSLQSAESRFTDSRLEVGTAFDWHFWRSSHLTAGGGARTVFLYDGHSGDDPSLSQEAAAGGFALPYGFDRGYTDVYDRLTAVIDTRPAKVQKSVTDQASEAAGQAPTPPPKEPENPNKSGTGLRLEFDGEQGSDVRRAPASGWIRYGATVSGFWDVNAGRILSLSVATEFADPLGNSPIPFTELVTLGGNHLMPGYYVGRMVDRSGAVATLGYDWPIGPWLDGSLQAAVGNVFGEHLDDFDPALLRFSGAFGLSIAGIEDPPIQFLLGFGTETFEDKARLDSFRLMVGVPHSF